MARAARGALATGARLARMEASPHWGEGTFHNPIPREEPRVLRSVWDAMRRPREGRAPRRPFALGTPDLSVPPPAGLRVTWLGHSSQLVELDGHRLLLDPVFAARASPVSFTGPLRFHPPPVALEALPSLDAVVISHDHYDHLDHATVVTLARTGVRFVVPLGVGAHLEHWGIAPSRITELDWWDTTRVGELTLTATPARHFSGRSWAFRDLFHTLWCGWAVHGPAHRYWFSGDTALFPGVREIGDRLGPFDLVAMESGGYSRNWMDVHIGPEQAVLAAQIVGARLLLPVHWATFDLGPHPWTEPVERVCAAGRQLGVPVTTPRPGEPVEPGRSVPTDRWWPSERWRTAPEAPIVSSRLDGEMVAVLAALGARV